MCNCPCHAGWRRQLRGRQGAGRSRRRGRDDRRPRPGRRRPAAARAGAGARAGGRALDRARGAAGLAGHGHRHPQQGRRHRAARADHRPCDALSAVDRAGGRKPAADAGSAPPAGGRGGAAGRGSADDRRTGRDHARMLRAHGRATRRARTGARRPRLPWRDPRGERQPAIRPAGRAAAARLPEVYEAPFGEPQLGTDSIPLHRPLAEAVDATATRSAGARDDERKSSTTDARRRPTQDKIERRHERRGRHRHHASPQPSAAPRAR